jgi:hypothetical protein
MLFTCIVVTGIWFARGGRLRKPSGLQVGFLAYTTFFLLYAAVSSNFRLFPGALLFWLSLGFVLTLSADRGPSPEDPGPPRAAVSSY